MTNDFLLSKITGPVKSKNINELRGHGHPVLDVAWNYDETILVSADSAGIVIAWKRVKQVKEDGTE